MRVAVYCRCSTAEQSVDVQLTGLREYAQARGFEIVSEYLDEGVSGARAKRPALDRLLADARRRRFDGVLVWKLDRLGRNLRHLLALLGELDELGVPRANLHWQLTELDKRSIRKIYHLNGQQMGLAGLGRVKLNDFLQVEHDNSWPEGTNGGWHHMGTTRMSDDP